MSLSGKQLEWRCRERTLVIGRRPLIMGVLNVTPDSFYDGGRYFSPARAIAHARQMMEEGSDILDVGGESSRPGAEPVPLEEELRRVLPVVKALGGEAPCLVSVDTTKAEVARCALEAGAHIVNDISALTADPAMVEVVREAKCGVVLMHMKGTPRTMQAAPRYDDVVTEVRDWLSSRLTALEQAGLDQAALVVDPGIGFGKTVEHNVQLLAGLAALQRMDRPILIGVSRKSFLGRLTGRDLQDRLAASLGALAYALLHGADIARVHDVKESCEVARVLHIFRQAESER
jgi:dihydropteroate synthase